MYIYILSNPRKVIVPTLSFCLGSHRLGLVCILSPSVDQTHSLGLLLPWPAREESSKCLGYESSLLLAVVHFTSLLVSLRIKMASVRSQWALPPHTATQPGRGPGPVHGLCLAGKVADAAFPQWPCSQRWSSSVPQGTWNKACPSALHSARLTPFLSPSCVVPPALPLSLKVAEVMTLARRLLTPCTGYLTRAASTSSPCASAPGSTAGLSTWTCW